MRSSTHRTTVAVAILLTGVAVVGCKRAKARADSNSETTQTPAEVKDALDGVTDDTIRITQVASLTGAQAGLGTEIYRGAMAYFMEVNAKGGINGRKIEIVPLDDHYNREGGEKSTERALNEEHGFIIFGATGTEPMGGILKTLQKYDSKKAFLWGSTSGAESSREGPLAQYAFNVRGSLKGAGKDIAEAYSSAGFKKVGIIRQDDGFGKSAAGAARKAAEDKGMQVVLEIPIPKTAKPDNTNATDMVNKMRAAGAEAMVLAATYNPAAVFMRDARDHGWNAPGAIMGTPDTALRFLAAHEKKTGKRMTNALLGCLNAPPVNADLPAVREYRDLMDKRNPRLPSQVADPNYRPLRYSSSGFEGFLMARVLGEALERAGKNLTRESLRKAAETIVSWDPGVGQRVSFGPTDNQGFDSIWLAGVKNDEFTIVPDLKKYLTDKPEPVVVAKEEDKDKGAMTAENKGAAGTTNAKTPVVKK
jgi:ABC-type branched-subunit amino acid transport system substrate-binding protein